MSRAWMCVCVSVGGLIYPPVQREVVFPIQYSWSRAHGSTYPTHCRRMKTIYFFVLTDAWRPTPHYHQHDRGRNRQYKKKMLNYFSSIDGQPSVLLALSRWSLHEYLFFHFLFVAFFRIDRFKDEFISQLSVSFTPCWWLLAKRSTIRLTKLAMFIPLCVLEKRTKQQQHL